MNELTKEQKKLKDLEEQVTAQRMRVRVIASSNFDIPDGPWSVVPGSCGLLGGNLILVACLDKLEHKKVHLIGTPYEERNHSGVDWTAEYNNQCSKSADTPGGALKNLLKTFDLVVKHAEERLVEVSQQEFDLRHAEFHPVPGEEQ